MSKPFTLSAPPLDFDVERFCERLAKLAEGRSPVIGRRQLDEGDVLAAAGAEVNADEGAEDRRLGRGRLGLGPVGHRHEGELARLDAALTDGAAARLGQL